MLSQHPDLTSNFVFEDFILYGSVLYYMTSKLNNTAILPTITVDQPPVLILTTPCPRAKAVKDGGEHQPDAISEYP